MIATDSRATRDELMKRSHRNHAALALVRARVIADWNGRDKEGKGREEEHAKLPNPKTIASYRARPGRLGFGGFA